MSNPKAPLELIFAGGPLIATASYRLVRKIPKCHPAIFAAQEAAN
jgi:hypothetical protein